MKTYEMIFMAVLLFWFVLVCLIRQASDHARYIRFGDWWFFDTAVLAFIILPMARFIGREKALKRLNWMLSIVVSTYTIFILWCLWNLFHLNIITLPSGNQVGMTVDMALLVGCNSNITGAISLTILAIACYLMITQKSVVLKILNAVAATTQLYTALLSNSRAVYVSILLLVSMAAFFTGWYCLKQQKLFIRLAVCVSAAVIGAAFIWGMRRVSFQLFDQVTHFSQLVDSGETAIESIREEIGLTGREAIWIASLKSMFSSPMAFFCGFTPFSVTEALQYAGGLQVEKAHAHNIILQVGVSFGVPMMIAFVVFLIKCAINCFRILFDVNSKNYLSLMMIATTIAALVALNMVEAYLIAYFSIMACVFFLYCGYAEEFGRIQKQK